MLPTVLEARIVGGSVAGAPAAPSAGVGVAASGAPPAAVSETREPDLDRLVCAMAKGDDSAFAALYRRTVAQVFAIARAILRSKEDTEEVVCDLYTHAWLKADTFDARRGSVMAWLAIMVRNRALDRLRQRRLLLSLDDERHEALVGSLVGSALGPEQLLAQFQSGSAVHSALALLTPERRYLVGLAFFQGLSHHEIAAAIGMPLGTVKSHVRRALASLQRHLSLDS